MVGFLINSTGTVAQRIIASEYGIYIDPYTDYGIIIETANLTGLLAKGVERGVHGTSNYGTGVYGDGLNYGIGLSGNSINNYGVYGYSNTNYSGYFFGSEGKGIYVKGDSVFIGNVTTTQQLCFNDSCIDAWSDVNITTGNSSVQMIVAVNGNVNSTAWNKTGTYVILNNFTDKVGIGTMTPKGKVEITTTGAADNTLLALNISSIESGSSSFPTEVVGAEIYAGNNRNDEGDHLTTGIKVKAKNNANNEFGRIRAGDFFAQSSNSASVDLSYGVVGNSSILQGTSIGIYGEATTDSGTAYAGYFGDGDVQIENDLDVDGSVTWSGGSSTNANTAYTHSQDNTQAHSDYLINNGDDTTSGKLTMAGFESSAASQVSSTFEIDNPNSGQLASFKGGADDTTYEYIRYYSGETSMMIHIWDGAYSTCRNDAADFCMRSENGFDYTLSSDNQLWLDADSNIYFSPNGDLDDYAYFTTVSNVPSLKTGGGTDLVIDPDGDQVIIGDASDNVDLQINDGGVCIGTSSCTVPSDGELRVAGLNDGTNRMICQKSTTDLGTCLYGGVCVTTYSIANGCCGLTCT